MNLLFYKMRTGKKGQIVAMLTVALVIFIIAAFIVVNLGKARIQDTKVNNAAQAAVLAGGSSASILLNSMANLNDQMVLNFAGFTLMIQFMLVSWIADYVQVINLAESTLEAFNDEAVANIILAVMTLSLTTVTMALMISGATKVGNAIKDMIDELNDKLPKNSRDAARQYAFSNVGVDEPKVLFSKSGCSDAWCYSLLETKFDEFMRSLPVKNKADMDYGDSKIEFDWDDSRNERIVTNKVAVTVTPVQKVPFRLMKFSDVADQSKAINDYLDEQELGLLGPLIRFGVTVADIIIALILSTVVLIGALAGILYSIALQANALALANVALCVLGCGPCCDLAIYYFKVASKLTTAATLAAAASGAFFIIYNIYPPGDIPCFVWEQRREHPISAEVTRTTTPSSINYGIYRTNWPDQTHQASGTVKDGSIFPPNQNFDIIPNF